MIASTQTGSSFAPAKPRPFSLQVRWLRYALLTLVGLVPALLHLIHHAELTYLHAAFVQFLAAGCCLVAGRRFAVERTRWRLVAAALALHALGYLSATMESYRWIASSDSAWLGNFGNAMWMVLLIPALMGHRVRCGRPVRTMDVALGVLSTVLLMVTLGSGSNPGNGALRIWTGVALLALLAVLALSLRLADARSDLRRFTYVMVQFLLLEFLDTVLVNVVLFLYLPHTPDLVADLLIPLPELLLCEWALRAAEPNSVPRLRLDHTLVDSLQPSVLTVMSVSLAMYGFRTAPVLASIAVVAVVLCYTVRTHAYYAHLFQERSRLLSTATEYKQLATQDPLTGIGNRRWFEASLQAALSNPDAFPCTLLLVDTDHFKEVNDRHGHDAGDAVLCAIAETLERETGHVRHTCVARIGGDEFAVLLREIPDVDALNVAQRIRAGVVQVTQARGYPATVSVGIQTVQEPVPRKQLLKGADAALYRAKAAGRNTVSAVAAA